MDFYNHTFHAEAELWDSHGMMYDIHMDFPSGPKTQIMKVWTTRCDRLVTKWRLIVNFEYTNNPDELICTLIVRRIDINEDRVRIKCYIELLDKYNEPLVDTRGFPFTVARHGEEFKEVYDPALSKVCVRRMQGQKLNVVVHLDVKGCHRPRPIVDRVGVEDIKKPRLFKAKL